MKLLKVLAIRTISPSLLRLNDVDEGGSRGVAVAVPNLLDRRFWIKKFKVDLRSATCEDWLLLG